MPAPPLAPLTLGQLFSRTLLVFAVLLGTAIAITINFERGLVVKSQPTEVTLNLIPYDAPITLTGTLIFYPNNVGLVPWIVYERPSGVIETKALVFNTPITLPPVGSAITITGLLEYEHVRVTALVVE